METKQDWKRLQDEYNRRGVSTEERIGVALMFLDPVVWLSCIAFELFA